MEKYALSVPQKLLAGCSIAIFVMGIMIILTVSITAYQDAHRPISLISSTMSPQNGSGTELTQGLYYGETAYQQSGYSQFGWYNNSAFLFDNSSIRIDQDKINVVSGYSYLIISGQNTLVFQGKELHVTNVSGLFDSNQNRFILLSGEVAVSEQETATINNAILYDGIKFTTATFDRSEFTTNPIWSEVTSALNEKRLLPDSLADTTPPTLELTNIEGGMQVTEELLKVEGITEPDAIVSINALPATVDSAGNFSKDLILEPGNNRIIIEARDLVGNLVSENLVITYEEQLPEPEVQVSNCTMPEFREQLLCRINEARLKSSLTTLSNLTALDNASQNHSDWMADNSSLEAVQTDGTTYIDRCLAVNTSCDGQLIGYTADYDSEVLLDNWLTQTEGSTLIYGDATSIGIGESLGYVTLLIN